MKIKFENFPPYYKEYIWSPATDKGNFFVGREAEFMGFWYQMTNLVGASGMQPRNMAFVGQRKLGKTAYLKRCYNIAFWEQDEVVPFYYSFAQNEQDSTKNVLQIKDLQRDMPILLLKQFFSFVSKDKNFISMRTSQEMLSYAKKIKFPKLERLQVGIPQCLEQINQSKRIFILRDIWEMTQWLTLLLDKKCLLIIDEAQEMQMSIYDGKEQFTCKGSIADIIQKQHSLVLISGSHISMLVNKFLDYDFANRFERVLFVPLRKKDAKELIRKKCSNRYKNLEDDFFELVGGNAYYIGEILSFNVKYMHTHEENKNFSSLEGLQKAYDFEISNSKGRIYQFWSTHLVKNKEDLNQDPDSKNRAKGLALQILYKITKNPDEEIYYEEFYEEFDIDRDTLETKLIQLENANLILPTGVGSFAYGFPDKVLPVMINQMYYQLLRTGPSKKIAEEARRDFQKIDMRLEKKLSSYKKYAKITTAKINKSKKKITKQMTQIALEIANIEKGVKQIQGIVNFKKGANAENKVRQKVRKMMQKQQGVFGDFELQGDVESVNITGSKGKGCQIDVYAKLKYKKKRGHVIFMAEVKNVKTKISLKQAEKFVVSMRKVKDVKKLKKIHAVYISTAGFVKNAEKYLTKHKISFGSSVDIL